MVLITATESKLGIQGNHLLNKNLGDKGIGFSVVYLACVKP